MEMNTSEDYLGRKEYYIGIAQKIMSNQGLKEPDINEFFDARKLCTDIVSFCKECYSGSSKMKEEFFVTAYYASICLTIHHLLNPDSYARDKAFAFLQSKCDTEFCDIYSDRMLGYAHNDTDSDNVWDIFLPYLGMVINNASVSGDFSNEEVLFAAMEPAIALGIAIANEYYEQEESVESVYAGERISVKLLVGRNYYHYVDGKVEKNQPLILNTDYVETDMDEEEEDEHDGGFSQSASLSAYISRDCWIKRISISEDEYNANAIVVIEVDNDFNIVNVSEIVEEFQHLAGGLIMIPGMGALSKRSYEIQDFLSEVTESEMELLLKGRYIPEDFSFLGKKMPAEMIEEDGDEDNNGEYSFARQSAYRLAYMDVSIETTEEGIIESIDYSTYQSTGSGYWDMFSRPTCIEDKHEEIVDMLLFILDKYSDDEYKTLIVT